MTAPPIDADFGDLLNPASQVSSWAHRNLNGRRSNGPLGLVGPGQPPGCSPVRHVLFVSGAGIARSWMAATLLAHYGGRYAHAGFDAPLRGALPRDVTTAMQEIGLTPQAEPAVHVEALPQPPDLLIAIGCARPRFCSRRTQVRTWNIPDPEGQPIDTVRAVRDAIAHRVQLLAAELRATS